MKLRLLKLDAFADRPLTGNPAAIVPLDAWLPDALMQSIAAENNQSETAFFVPQGDGYGLRWFTPNDEVALCGHATLGAAYVLFRIGAAGGEAIAFETLSGTLTVCRAGDDLVMDFPTVRSAPVAVPPMLVEGLGAAPREVWAGADYMAVFGAEAEVRALKPDMRALERLDRRGVIASAPGATADFCSRFFAPKFGVPEDPVTGSAHCQLAPYWSKKLGKKELLAHQVSARGGEVRCVDRGQRVELAGTVAPYLDATISL